jgi:hypothetical protein
VKSFCCWMDEYYTYIGYQITIHIIIDFDSELQSGNIFYWPIFSFDVQCARCGIGRVSNNIYSLSFTSDFIALKNYNRDVRQ